MKTPRTANPASTPATPSSSRQPLSPLHAVALSTIAQDPAYIRSHVTSTPTTPSPRTQELLSALTQHDVPDWML
jgi:hypothetical protein